MKAGTESAANPPDWRNKYYDSLDSLEREQKQFKALESVFKRLSGRLCIAALGQSPRLDGEIKKLQSAVRGDLNTDDLDKIAASLTEAINALDQPAQAAATTPAATAPGPTAPKTESTSAIPSAAVTPTNDIIVGDERVRSILAALIAELRRDPELLAAVDAVDTKLAGPIRQEHLPDLLSSMTELITQRIQHIELAKQEVEALLSQMASKLDEISQSVADQSEHHNQSLANSETLNTHLASEMKAMGENVESAGDLQQLRTQVRSRLDSIDKCLHDFRQREATLASSFLARNEKMAARVAELEAETNRLQSQLKSEQRTASIDTLTKIPNRLAYEKRMEEELKRFQRFKQPTCVAAWDIDHFKRINDTYGHRAGDGVLRAVADCLSGRIRSTDFIARYGGEEFVMILAGTKLEDAARLVDLMRIAVSKLKLHFRGTPLAITISVGVTALQEGDLMGSAFERADKGLYQAKERGRNCCVTV